MTWNDIGWGIKLPKLSVSWNALGGIFDKPTILGSSAGLQGVGEAGAEAILPLGTLWAEMSARLKAGMIDVMSGFMNERSTGEHGIPAAGPDLRGQGQQRGA